MERAVAEKTTRITVETETLMIVRRAKAVLAWCPDCRADVEVIVVDNHSFKDPATAARIEEWFGSGKLHLWQLANGPAQICLTSLLECFESEQVQRLFHTHQNHADQFRRKQK